MLAREVFREREPAAHAPHRVCFLRPVQSSLRSRSAAWASIARYGTRNTVPPQLTDHHRLSRASGTRDPRASLLAAVAGSGASGAVFRVFSRIVRSRSSAPRPGTARPLLCSLASRGFRFLAAPPTPAFPHGLNSPRRLQVPLPCVRPRSLRLPSPRAPPPAGAPRRWCARCSSRRRRWCPA